MQSVFYPYCLKHEIEQREKALELYENAAYEELCKSYVDYI